MFFQILNMGLVESQHLRRQKKNREKIDAAMAIKSPAISRRKISKQG
jgi:hypothetical protein